MNDLQPTAYPAEFKGLYMRHQTAAGFVFMTTAAGYFPEDVLPRIKNITTEEINKALTQ